MLPLHSSVSSQSKKKVHNNVLKSSCASFFRSYFLTVSVRLFSSNTAVACSQRSRAEQSVDHPKRREQQTYLASYLSLQKAVKPELKNSGRNVGILFDLSSSIKSSAWLHQLIFCFPWLIPGLPCGSRPFESLLFQVALPDFVRGKSFL